MSKTRNELQKNIEYLVSENNRLQSELEHQEQLVIELQSDIDTAQKEQSLYGEAIRKSMQSDVDNLRTIVMERNKERRTIKSYNLFQLIRWWWDAKN